jgi:hypothetical protein
MATFLRHCANRVSGEKVLKWNNLFYKTEVPVINEFFGGFERSATTSVYADPASGKSIIGMQAAFDHTRINEGNVVYKITDKNIGFADIQHFWKEYDKVHQIKTNVYGAIYNPTEKDILELDPDVVFRMEEYVPKGKRKPRYRLVFEERHKMKQPFVLAMKIADPLDVLMLYGVPLNIEKSEKGMLTARYAQQDAEDTRVLSPLSSVFHQFCRDYAIEFIVLDSISSTLGLFELGGRVNLMARFEAAQALMMRMNTVNAALNAAVFAIVHAGGDPSTGSVTMKGGAGIKFSTKATFRILNKTKWTSKKKFKSFRLAQRMRQNWEADGSAASWISFDDAGFAKVLGEKPDYLPDTVEKLV